jgi:hypothetical protein
MPTLRNPERPMDGERPQASSSGWVNAAFVVEALVLLAAIVACMAVFTSLFAKSAVAAKNSTVTTHAVQLAQCAAEEFSSDPEAVANGEEVGEGVAAGSADDELSVSCDVDEQTTGTGALYTAHITVSNESGETVYAVDATRYVKEAR